MLMIIKTRLLGLLIAGIVLSGCSFNVPKYNADAFNVKKMESIPTSINVGTFTATKPGVTSITCRAAGSVGTPDGSTFEQFIRNAFISELKIAKKYNPNSKITLTGHLEEIDFNSNLGTADWVMRLTATSSNSRSITINTKYDFDGSFIANQACADVASAFIPAIQKLISNLINNRDFYTLLK